MAGPALPLLDTGEPETASFHAISQTPVKFRLIMRDSIATCEAPLLQNESTQLGGPDTGIINSTFGSINSSWGERTAQFSLRLHF